MQSYQVGDRVSVSCVTKIGSESRAPAEERLPGTVRLLDPHPVGAATDPGVLVEVEIEGGERIVVSRERLRPIGSLQTDIIKDTLQGNYGSADSLAANVLEGVGSVEVMTRAPGHPVQQYIERRLRAERGRDGLYRLLLDGAGGLPRPGRRPAAWPTAGFTSANRAVSEARKVLTEGAQ